MASKNKDKTFKIIIFISALITVASVVLCIFLVFSSKKNTPVNLSTNITTAPKGEFVGYILPSENKLYKPNETVVLSVSARSGAQAYAMIAGQKIPLTVSSVNTDGYNIYSGNLVLPAGKNYIQELGNIAFFVTYEGVTQIFYGGEISIETDFSVTAATTENTTAIQTQGNTAASSSKALVVTGMITEGKEIKGNELLFNPTYGNLVSGMTDYVTEKIIDFDDDGNEVDFYKLMSGRAVRADGNVSLKDAPETVSFGNIDLSVESDVSGKKIVLKDNNSVPYKLNYVGQAFSKGYEGLKYNVSSFTASAVDFIFEYTVSFSGSLSDFSDEIVSSVTAVLSPENKTMTLHCTLRNPGKFYGYIMERDQSGNLTISFKKPVRSLNELKVIIDPGHGGNPGALDKSGKYHEADQTLAISKNLAAYLSSAGATVYMTRTSDTDVSLEARRLMNQQIKPDLFISVHLNAAKNHSKSGTSTFYFTPFSQALASCINNRLTSIFYNCYKNNSAMYKNVNGGDNYYPFFVTRTDVCPSVLVEVGFISNELECKYLVDEAYHQAFGRAIFDAVCDYISRINQ